MKRDKNIWHAIKISLLLLLLIGGTHWESFGQNSQNANPLRFKTGDDVLYEYYANNKQELIRISALIEKHSDDILLNNGHFQLVAFLPKGQSDDPTTLNQAAQCAAVVCDWMRHQKPSRTKIICAFSFSTSDAFDIEITVDYIAAPLDASTPQAIHFSNDKGNIKAIQSALSKYGTLPFIVPNNSEVYVDKKLDDTSGQTPTATNTHQALPSVSTDSTTILIPDFIIYFRLDKSDIDPTYMNNAVTLDRINSIVTERNIAYIDSLIISAYASPEAPSAYNKRLSEQRANAVKDYLLKRFNILKSDIVHAYGYGENWEDLRQMAEADTQLPMKDEVLRIIDSDLSEDERESRLKALQAGTVYRYIYRNYYPRLRLGTSLNVLLAETAPSDLRSLIFEPLAEQFTIHIDPIEMTLPPIAICPVRPIEPIKEEYRYPFALRTNLLYDAVGALNVGVEIPLGSKKNWSVIADIAYSYWRTQKNLYALQTLEYGTELRYWFGASERKKERNPNWAKPLKGWNVGVYGRYWQRYDVQWIDGYQGDGSWSAGLTAGYSFPISRCFAFETSIGAGWFSTSEYRHYHQPEYDEYGKYHLMWQQTGSWGGLSLTKLRFSLMWLIESKKTRRDNR